MDSLVKSYEDFLRYPTNVLETDLGAHTLQAYHTRLQHQKDRLFVDETQASVSYLDLTHAIKDAIPKVWNSLGDVKRELGEASQMEQKKSRCRFIFLHADHDGAPLKITLEMLMFLFTYHQVLPSFLDFIFPFGRHPHPQGFLFSDCRRDRFKTMLWAGTLTNRAPDTEWGDIRLHNLRAVERQQGDSAGPLPWAVRQVAVYQTFDPDTSNALWVIVKGNRVLESRISQACAQRTMSRKKKSKDARAMALVIHSMIIEWSGENWRWYLDDLEERSQSLTQKVLFARLSDGPQDNTSYTLPQERLFVGNHTPSNDRHQIPSGYKSRNAVPDNKYKAGSLPDPLSATGTRPYEKFGIFNDLTSSQNQDYPISAALNDPERGISTEERHCGANEAPELERSRQSDLTFDDLQQVQLLQEKVEEALLIAQLNVKVIKSFSYHQEKEDYYSGNTRSFTTFYRSEAEPWFRSRVEETIKEFESSRPQLESLLKLLANRKELLKDTLQYRSVKANEETANKTRQEATSMKIITSVTLFFLPATFIATFMSTNIVSYENGNSNIETGGLKTYLAITLPLTALTFLAWYVIYRYARETGFSRNRGRHGGENGQHFV